MPPEWYGARYEADRRDCGRPRKSATADQRIICAQTHRLIAQVLDGNLCASMCIPIFLQGDDRFAAQGASNWIFHEATRPGANGKERTDITWCLFRKCYVPAGVSMDWLKSIVPIIQHANLLQTGSDLISAKTGIIMCQIAEPNRAGRGRSIGGRGHQRTVSIRRSAPPSCASAPHRRDDPCRFRKLDSPALT